VYRETAWNFDGKESLGKVFVLRQFVVSLTLFAVYQDDTRITMSYLLTYFKWFEIPRQDWVTF
jgi:hypothetical protein